MGFSLNLHEGAWAARLRLDSMALAAAVVAWALVEAVDDARVQA